MKRQWKVDELVEHFTLHETERDLLANKTGATRLGFAVLLKYFQQEAHFPTSKHDVPKLVIAHSARQLGLSAELYLLPTEADAFVTVVQERMRKALSAFDASLPKNTHVRILPKGLFLFTLERNARAESPFEEGL